MHPEIQSLTNLFITMIVLIMDPMTQISIDKRNDENMFQ